jgi:DNA helicase-2/ATP-dependent DNA helicase PcrA
MKIAAITSEPTLDDIDKEILGYLQLAKPVSFFLFAGAGSGKTRSLVNALKYLPQGNKKQLLLRSQKIGVITYTNAACDEIMQRLNFDPLVEVKTINSFVWSLIANFHTNIKDWLIQNLQNQIEELTVKQQKGRASQAAIDRANSIATKQERLARLAEVKRFTYSPKGKNQGYDSLNHSEVIKIATDFLINKPLMRNILASKYPILLIDESQDTHKELLEAIFKVQAELKERFMLGLFGDMMQRIYEHGKKDLRQQLPEDWAEPKKLINYRCPRRVITLINQIRSTVDEHQQVPASTNEDGFVRLFILPNNIDKQTAEIKIAKEMAKFTRDNLWETSTEVKTLILEHHMAAKRMGFLEVYQPLNKIDKLKTGLLDGTLSGIHLFTNLILPVVEAKQRGDEFTVATIVRTHSPLLSKNTLQALDKEQMKQLKKAKEAVQTLMQLWSNNHEPQLINVLSSIHQTNLFEIPECFQPIVARSSNQQQLAEKEITDVSSITPYIDEEDNALNAWDTFLLAPFSQIKPYASYVNQQANFDTHQGVKGREFPRVMVIIDDSEAKGFSFSYDKLFKVKAENLTAKKNKSSDSETTSDRTRRLFYVTCSRAAKSLAIVAYSNPENLENVKAYTVEQKWFTSDEIIVNGP